MRRKPVLRRRKSVKRIVVTLLAMIVIAVAGVGGAAFWGMNAARAPGPLNQPVNVVIEHGQPTTEIGVALERSGVVSDHRLFTLASYLTRASRGDLKAGEYEFPAGSSLAQVLAIIRSGRAVVHKVTVPEGWTSADVVERVNAHPALSGTIADLPPEGSLLPDTYVFQRGVTRDALIARMRQAQQAVLDELWDKRAADLPIKTREEAVILASIVEKETGVAAERPQVAAVFVNRLRQNMRLQSDPTIIYGITGGAGRLDRPITRSDISEATPYNTYRIDGLPPTPIANPGRDAIAAVLQPGTTDHLYFVADGSGGHAFAKTLSEHNENVQRWRKIERTLEGDSEEPPLAADAPETPAAVPPEPAAATEASKIAASAAVPAVTASGEDKVRDIMAAAAAEDEPVGPEDPADDTPPPAEAAAPPPKSRTGPAATLAGREVPLPMPKPQRN